MVYKKLFLLIVLFNALLVMVGFPILGSYLTCHGPDFLRSDDSGINFGLFVSIFISEILAFLIFLFCLCEFNEE